jgi:hypothetical protein
VAENLSANAILRRRRPIGRLIAAGIQPPSGLPAASAIRIMRGSFPAVAG